MIDHEIIQDLFEVYLSGDARKETKKAVEEHLAECEACRKAFEQAQAAGTSSREVEIETRDNITAAADGKKVFLNRSINAKLTGKPDSTLLAAN